MVRKKTAGKSHQYIDTTVMKIICCNKNKKLKDCITESTERRIFLPLCSLCPLWQKNILPTNARILELGTLFFNLNLAAADLMF